MRSKRGTRSRGADREIANLAPAAESAVVLVPAQCQVLHLGGQVEPWTQAALRTRVSGPFASMHA